MGEQSQPRKRRRNRNSGGLFEKNAYWVDKTTGEKNPYKYWQATKELSGDDLPEGATRRRITGSGATKSEALARLDANLRKYLKQDKAPEIRKAGAAKGPTLDEWFETWYSQLYSTVVSETVKARYRGHYENHIKTELGAKRLIEITAEDCRKLFLGTLPDKRKERDGQSTEERLLGASAIGNVRKVLNNCLNSALNQGLIGKNPVKQVKTEKARKSERASDVLANGERLRRLFETELDRRSYEHYCLRFLSMLGLRQSEKLGLCWSSFDNLDGLSGQPEMTIDRQLDRHVDGSGWYIKHVLKNNSEPRTIPLFEPFLTVIREYRIKWDEMSQAPGWDPPSGFEDALFLWPTGKPITARQDTVLWHQLLDEHDIPYFRSHQIRHITATWLADNPNVPVESVAALLGHESTAMTAWYARITQTQTARAVQSLGQSFPALTEDAQASGMDRVTEGGIPASALLQKLKWAAEDEERKRSSKRKS
jgi:integrase